MDVLFHVPVSVLSCTSPRGPATTSSVGPWCCGHRHPCAFGMRELTLRALRGRCVPHSLDQHVACVYADYTIGLANTLQLGETSAGDSALCHQNPFVHLQHLPSEDLKLLYIHELNCRALLQNEQVLLSPFCTGKLKQR